MFQIRISKRRRLRAGSSLRRAATVLSLLVLCLIPRDQAFPRQSREKEREQRILQIQQLFGQGDLAEARRLLNEAMKQFPADAGLDNLLGIIEAQEGNYAAAERSFNQAVARDRKFTGAYLNLGRLYQEHATEDPQALPKALEVYSRALQYEPDNAEANYQSAALLMRKGAYQASLDHLSRLPATIQNSAQALSVSCADYAGLGRGERANESAERLLAHPDFSEPDVSAALPALTGNGSRSRPRWRAIWDWPMNRRANCPKRARPWKRRSAETRLPRRCWSIWRGWRTNSGIIRARWDTWRMRATWSRTTPA
jgi:tetratricopeptide (TPR) repeat protein